MIWFLISKAKISAFLFSAPKPHPGRPVEVIENRISIVHFYKSKTPANLWIINFLIKIKGAGF
jgi:hypothetical protein